MSPLTILFVAMRWDYKDPQRGDSFEYANLFDALRRMPGVTAELFPFDDIERRLGRRAMNDELVRRVRSLSPDLVFFFLFEHELALDTVDAVTRLTPTFNWFADDRWRFEIFSRVWAPHFTLVGTTDEHAVERYAAAGITNVIKLQWACNQYLYHPLDIARDLDVTFVGQAHGDRRRTVAELERRGIPLQTWGAGWPKGRTTQDEMVRIFSRSKVNLNFAAGSAPRGLMRQLQFLLFDGTRLAAPSAWGDRVRALGARRAPQLKGRTFEIAGCRTLLLTQNAAGLSDYYEPGTEVAAYDSFDELRDLCLYHLEHREESERMAVAAYERTLREHTYEARFAEIFRALDLSPTSDERTPPSPPQTS